MLRSLCAGSVLLRRTGLFPGLLRRAGLFPGIGLADRRLVGREGACFGRVRGLHRPTSTCSWATSLGDCSAVAWAGVDWPASSRLANRCVAFRARPGRPATRPTPRHGSYLEAVAAAAAAGAVSSAAPGGACATSAAAPDCSGSGGATAQAASGAPVRRAGDAHDIALLEQRAVNPSRDAAAGAAGAATPASRSPVSRPSAAAESSQCAAPGRRRTRSPVAHHAVMLRPRCLEGPRNRPGTG